MSDRVSSRAVPLTVVARELGISPRTARRAALRFERAEQTTGLVIPAVRVGGSWLVPSAWLDTARERVRSAARRAAEYV